MSEITNLERLKAQAYELEATNKSVSIVTDYVGMFGVKAGYLLSQCRYYERRFAEENRLSSVLQEDGTRKLFWWHTDEQWMKELNLGSKELKNAKERLITEGVLVTLKTYSHLPTYYRIDRDRLAELYVEYAKANKILPDPNQGVPAETDGTQTAGRYHPKRQVGTIPNGRTSESNVQSNKKENTLSEKTETGFPEQSAVASHIPSFENESNQETNLGANEAVEQAAVKKTTRPDHIVTNFILEFCTARTTPEQIAALAETEWHAIRTEGKRLRNEPGFDVNKLPAFKAWYQKEFAWKAKSVLPYKIIRANWQVFLGTQATETVAGGKVTNGRIKTAQGERVVKISPDGKQVGIYNLETGTLMRKMSIEEFRQAYGTEVTA